uniref:Uncharacterized protein n=1 Tax=Caenorhabditis tropicalis TaxID=1561998 RepID=A0A1I7UWQ5_9PELO
MTAAAPNYPCAAIIMTEDILKKFKEDYVNDDDPYALNVKWVHHLFFINKCNETKTEEALKKDKEDRNSIREKHNIRKDFNLTERNVISTHQSELSIKELEGQIYNLVAGRNVSFENLASIPPEYRTLDLHWFLTSQALDYVQKLIDFLNNDPDIGVEQDFVVHLVTGAKGIKEELLKKFPKELTPANTRAVLELTIKKKSHINTEAS